MILNEFRDRFDRLETSITELRINGNGGKRLNEAEPRRVPTPLLDDNWEDNNDDGLQFERLCLYC